MTPAPPSLSGPAVPRGQGEKDLVDFGPDDDERLTAREAEVVGLVARGMSNKAIAHQLGISPRTVEGHLNHVFDKLGILSRTELVHYALAGRLLGRDAEPGAAPGVEPGDRHRPRRTVVSPASDAGRHRGHGISTARSPWTDSRFGLLQLAVLAVALVRLAVTVAFGLDIGDAVLEVSTVALFVVPVVIASLNFGVTGRFGDGGVGGGTRHPPDGGRGRPRHRSRPCGPRSSNSSCSWPWPS